MAVHRSDASLTEMRCGKMKPLMIGQQPNSNPPDQPLSAAHPAWTGARLARIMGVTPEVYEDTFDRVNVLYDNTYNFSVNAMTRSRGRALIQQIRSEQRSSVILLGKSVAQCLLMWEGSVTWKESAPEVRISFIADCHVFIIPHPSGLNRQMNDPMVVQTVRELLTSFVRK